MTFPQTVIILFFFLGITIENDIIRKRGPLFLVVGVADPFISSISK